MSLRCVRVTAVPFDHPDGGRAATRVWVLGHAVGDRALKRRRVGCRLAARRV